MARQWEGTTSSAAITGGTKVVVPVKCPSRGQLQKLVVKQTAGTLVAFTVDLFANAAKAALYAAGTSDDFNRVVAQQSSDAVGKMAKFFDTDATGGFENQDNGPSNRLYLMYAVIAPAGVQAGLTFDVTLGLQVSPDCT